jgi:hypothetical protein
MKHIQKFKIFVNESFIIESNIEDLFNHEQRNIQLTLDMKKLSEIEFQEVYNSLNQNPEIYRIRIYGNGFLEVDLIELSDENKATILKYKDRIKII